MENEVKALNEDFKLCLTNIVKHNKVILYCTIVGLILGILLGINVKEDKYTASSTICNASFSSYEQIVAMGQVFKDCEVIATSYSVASRAALMLGDSTITPEQIQEMIDVSSESSESYVATVSCTSTNSELSIKVVNAVADSIVMEMNQMTGTKCVQILDDASTAKESTKAVVIKIVLMAVMALIGCLLPILCIVFMVLFSKKIISIEDCTLEGKLNLIGVIPAAERTKTVEKK